MRLSVCIPTHHGRGRFLKEAVDSVLSQITPALAGQVEICISDNASTDETQALVAAYSREHPGLFLYHRHPVNLGFTRNLMHVISMAQGDYCWLFSSDDLMAAGGLSRVFEVLHDNPGIAGMTIYLHVLHLWEQGEEVHWPPNLLPSRPEEPHLLTSPDEIFRNCGSIQGYTSAQIFDRRLWLETLREVGETCFTSFRYFPYLYLFGKMVKKRPLWLWLPDRLVICRSDNDYLSAEMSFNYLQYHVSTMAEVSRVWGLLFSRNSTTYKTLMRNNYLSFWSWAPIVRYKMRSNCTLRDDWKALVGFTRCLYFLPGFWVFALPFLLLPHPAVRRAVRWGRSSALVRLVRAVKRRVAGGQPA